MQTDQKDKNDIKNIKEKLQSEIKLRDDKCNFTLILFIMYFIIHKKIRRNNNVSVQAKKISKIVQRALTKYLNFSPSNNTNLAQI